MEKKLKIAIIGTKGYPYVYGGYETLIKELVERLVNKDLEVTVYCHRSLFKDKPAIVNGIKLVYVPAIELKAFSQLTHSFFSTLHACFSNADVLFYVNAANGPFGLLTKIFKKKTAINVDGLEWLRPKWKGLGAKYFYYAAKKATKYFDVIITDAFAMQKIYKDLFNVESKMIAYGTEPYQHQSIQVLNKWSLETNDYYLIVGRLIPDNNSDLIIKSFLQFESKKKLVIVGDDIFNNDFAVKIKAMIQGHDNIIFTGYVTNPIILSALYQHAFAYIHGHEFGGTNPTLVKAMGEGAYILALNNQFNSEVLQGGLYGSMFEKNYISLTEIMKKAELQELEKSSWLPEMKSIARTGVVERYQWDYIAGQYYQIFINL